MTENQNPSAAGERAADSPAASGTDNQSHQPTSVYPQPYPGFGTTAHYPTAQAPGGQYAYGQYAQAYGQAPAQTAEYPAWPGYGQQYGTSGYGASDTGVNGGSVPPSGFESDRTGDGRPSASRPRALVATAAIAALVGGGVGGGIVAAADRNGGSTVNTGIKITNATGAPAAQTNGTVAAAATKIRPSVVTIDVTGATSEGTGSGVILRSEGYILTNNHVVAVGNGGGSIEVTLADGRTASARIVGQDPSDDLAVIKVDGLANLTPATFAKSSQLTVGQSVVAVGAPLGLSDTVTAGIVSNTARPVTTGSSSQESVFLAIQTDAAINPGNSGGPLVDLNGSVVGINSAIADTTNGSNSEAGNIGIGFAIPSDEASRIAGELIAQGKAYHAVIGVSVPSQQQQSTKNGVPLTGVNAGGAAAAAGLKVGDVITAVNDTKVRTSEALIAYIRSYAPGDQVKISFLRGSSTQTVSVTLGKSAS